MTWIPVEQLGISGSGGDSVLIDLPGSGSDRGTRGFSHSFLFSDSDHGSFISCCSGLGSGIFDEGYCGDGSRRLCYESSCSRIGSTHLGVVARCVGGTDSDDGGGSDRVGCDVFCSQFFFSVGSALDGIPEELDSFDPAIPDPT